jgi:hypothetical protein
MRVNAEAFECGCPGFLQMDSQGVKPLKVSNRRTKLQAIRNAGKWAFNLPMQPAW